jgi:hypothetical protein
MNVSFLPERLAHTEFGALWDNRRLFGTTIGTDMTDKRGHTDLLASHHTSHELPIEIILYRVFKKPEISTPMFPGGRILQCQT